MWQLTNTYNWNHLNEKFSWIRDMKGVLQDPLYHAEGDVWIHTKAVFEALIALPEFQSLVAEEQEILRCAALMHDIEKRSTTIWDDGRWRSPNHARKGAQTVREMLYTEFDCPFAIREQIAMLVKNHGVPIWAIEREDPKKTVIRTSLQCNTHLLYLLSKADVLGRICIDKDAVLDRVDLFKMLCEENECYGEPKYFGSPAAQFHYLNTESKYPDYLPFDDNGSTVYLLSALPGSGKDHYCANHFGDLPIVSLDGLRKDRKVRRGDKKAQGQVIQLAKEQAKVLLRKKEDFVWNATNVTRQMRDQILGLFLDYKAKVKIVYVEVSFKQLIRQNGNREDAIPEKSIRKMIQKLEVPLLEEAYEIIYII